MLKSTPALILIKTVFDMEDVRTFYGRRIAFLIYIYMLFLQLTVLNYDDW